MYIILQASFLFHLVNAWNTYCNIKCSGYSQTVCVMEPCNPNKKCGINFLQMPFEDSEKEQIVETHNECRQAIASGDFPEGGNAAAANMNAISYSKELEFIAQCWANNCNSGGSHDVCRRTMAYSNVGQTIVTQSSRHPWNFTSYSTTVEFIQKWFYAVLDTTAKLLANYTTPSSGNVENFIQMIWAKTKYVGCGRTMHGRDLRDNNVVIVCNYAPGVVIGQPVYTKGIPCSKCDPNLSCNKNHRALCGQIQPLGDDTFSAPFSLAGHADSEKLLKVLIVVRMVIFYVV